MRYSGMAIGGAALFMASYLALTQWERVVTAYTGPLGLIAGIVGRRADRPVHRWFLLSRADDLDY